MDCYWKHWKRLHFVAVIVFCFCFCLVIRQIYTTNSDPKSRYETGSTLSFKVDNRFRFLVINCNAHMKLEKNKIWEMAKRVRGGRRLLGGLGSSPPRCTSKCGECTPCKPVHVPVPPGAPVTLEYYPEAWRCKCGNKLFVP